MLFNYVKIIYKSAVDVLVVTILKKWWYYIDNICKSVYDNEKTYEIA